MLLGEDPSAYVSQSEYSLPYLFLRAGLGRRLEPSQPHGGVYYGRTEGDRAVAVSSTIE
jgi:hypothetical protein